MVPYKAVGARTAEIDWQAAVGAGKYRGPEIPARPRPTLRMIAKQRNVARSSSRVSVSVS